MCYCFEETRELDSRDAVEMALREDEGMAFAEYQRFNMEGSVKNLNSHGISPVDRIIR
jgi:hypothetical protein